jgi:hypothetical protein
VDARGFISNMGRNRTRRLEYRQRVASAAGIRRDQDFAIAG